MRYIFVAMLFVLPFLSADAQEALVHQELKETVRAEVVEIVSTEEREIIGTDAVALVQDVRALVLEGAREGDIISFEDDLVELIPGDSIFINRLETIDGFTYFTFKDVERRGALMWLSALFILLLFWFARWQGIRALASLALSVAAILFILVPALLNGYNPVLVSLGVAGAILAVVLFGTHGFNPRSTIAFFGTFSAVLVTSLIAVYFTNAMRLTGFGADASVYLNFQTGGELDFAGLLLGSIIIGILGVLDDVSITQASVVQELKSANHALEAKALYTRAIRVGRDHVGSLVNTLALAYVGVSLPLILLYASGGSDFWLSLNQEVIASELTRIIVGSIGLVLAVPLTTAIAAWYFGRLQGDALQKISEEDVPHHCGHHH